MKERYLLIVYDTASEEIYYANNDNLQKLLFDFLTADDHYFNEFITDAGNSYINYDEIVDYYEIVSIVLIDLKEGKDWIHPKEVFEKLIPKDFKKMSDLRKLGESSLENNLTNNINIIL